LHGMEWSPWHCRSRTMKRWSLFAHDLTHGVRLIRSVRNSPSESGESEGHLLCFVFAKS
jgi:hypothetical protein